MHGPIAVVLALAASWRPPELQVKDPPPVEDFDNLKEIALQYLGRPYVMGGVGRPGMDCSGFTCRVFAEAGYAIPRVSRDQARVGEPVSLDRVAPGDLLFFAEPGQPISHVGIYLGDERLVHASSGQGEVVVADLGQRWFRTHLVSARRILGGRAVVEDLTQVELDEHAGPFMLPLTLRREPPRRVRLDPMWLSFERTHLGVRSGIWTESGQAAPVVAPEIGFVIRKWGVSGQAAVPIRMDPGDRVRVGPIDNFGDALRFVRSLRIGLPEAALEIALDRQRSLRLLSGRLVDRFVPGLRSPGIPGLAIGQSPLSGTFRLRGPVGGVETLVDDVVDPRTVGVGGSLDLSRWVGPWAPRIELDWVWDRGPSVPRAPNAHLLGAAARWTVVRQRRFELGGGPGASFRVQSDRVGFGADLSGGFVHRFGPRLDDAWGLDARVGVAGPAFFAQPVGLVHPLSGPRLTAEAPGTPWRGITGADLFLQAGPVRSFVEATTGFAGGQSLDHRWLGGLGLRGVSLGGDRRLDLRVGGGFRGALSRAEAVAFGSARLAITSFLDAEAQALRGPSGWEGGAGLRLTLRL